MKGIDISCASRASTAICLSMDPRTSSALELGGKAIDRHNPIIRDERRIGRGVPTPHCSTHQSPINPIPYQNLQKSGRSSSESKGNGKKSSSHRKKNSKTDTTTTTDVVQKHAIKPTEISSSCIEPGGLVTPPESSRYLLSEAAYFGGLTDYEPGSTLALVESKRDVAAIQDEVLAEPKKTMDVSKEKVLVEIKDIQAIEQHKSKANNPASASLPGSASSNQVVVLRVSLHCKGCARKVSKYLSKMQGVTSFNIDFAKKKVTVVGDVTPLSVLASISKVKNAQIWMPGSAGNNDIKK